MFGIVDVFFFIFGKMSFKTNYFHPSIFNLLSCEGATVGGPEPISASLGQRSKTYYLKTP